jgi:hypothetical protein
MARDNYGRGKRQREIARKKKQEDKRKKMAERRQAKGDREIGSSDSSNPTAPAE